MRDKTEYYHNRTLLTKLLGEVFLPPGLNDKQRKRQIEKGVLPKRFNCHHTIPLGCGGNDNIWDLAIMLKTNHKIAHIILDKAGVEAMSKKDRPFFEYVTAHQRGYTYAMTKQANKQPSPQ